MFWIRILKGEFCQRCRSHQIELWMVPLKVGPRGRRVPLQKRKRGVTPMDKKVRGSSDVPIAREVEEKSISEARRRRNKLRDGRAFVKVNPAASQCNPALIRPILRKFSPRIDGWQGKARINDEIFGSECAAWGDCEQRRDNERMEAFGRNHDVKQDSVRLAQRQASPHSIFCCSG